MHLIILLHEINQNLILVHEPNRVYSVLQNSKNFLFYFYLCFALRFLIFIQLNVLSVLPRSLNYMSICTCHKFFSLGSFIYIFHNAENDHF